MNQIPATRSPLATHTFLNLKTLALLSAVLLTACGEESPPPGTPGTPGNSTPAADKAAVSGDKRATTAIAIPAQLDQLAAHAVLTVEANQADSLVLNVAKLTAGPVDLTLDAGTICRPIDVPDASPRAVASTVRLTIDAPGKYAFHAVTLDIANWSKGSKTYALAAPPEGDRLPAVLGELAGKDVTWSERQIAAWTIRGDIDVDQLNDKAISQVHAFAPADTAVTFRIWSYRGVLRVEDAMTRAGLKPDEFRIFAGNRARRDKALAMYPVDDWSADLTIGSIGNRFNGMKEYLGDPAVTRIVKDYARLHHDDYLRSQAADFIVDNDLLADMENDALYAAAIGDEARMIRLAAAATLLKRDDRRAEPLLTVYGEDKQAYDVFAEMWKYKIGTPSRKERPMTGTLQQHWVDDLGGWSRLPEAQVPNVKADHAALLQKEEQYIAEMLKPFTLDSDAKTSHQLGRIAGRFDRHPAVFARLAQLASSHADEQVRIAALAAMRQMRGFAPFDVAMDRLVNDTSARVRAEAARIDPGDDPANRKRFILAAGQSPDPQVRIQAIDKVMGQSIDTEIESMLARLATSDQDIEVRRKAVERLARTQAPTAVTTFSLIADQAEAPERVVFEMLSQLPRMADADAARTLALRLARDHADAKVRGVALSQLANFRDKPYMDVALERFKEDASANVQSAAVLLAARAKGDDDAAGTIIELGLASDHPATRALAASACGTRKLTSLADQLKTLAESDPDEKVRREAKAALRRLE